MAAVIGNRKISLGVLGGTLITAACYSGGNVFGCSPYDAATTAYLKATYPSYWAQIRDYGFANPQLVPWINEDNDLIVSLVGVGKERWLVGDKKSGISTNVEISKYLGINIYSKSNGLGANTTVIGSNTSGRIGMSYYTSEKSYVLHYENTYNVENNFPSQFTPHLFSINTDIGKFYIDGVLYRTWTWTYNPSGTNVNIGSSPTSSEKPNSSIKYVEFIDNRNGNVLANFVPFKRNNGDIGMLETIQGVYYPNHTITGGSFTIELTDTPS